MFLYYSVNTGFIRYKPDFIRHKPDFIRHKPDFIRQKLVLSENIVETTFFYNGYKRF